MTDRRTLFATPRVAHVSLRGKVAAESFAEAVRQRIARPVADLCAGPGGARDRQVLWGQRVDVLERQGGWAFVRLARDAYVGWVETDALAGDLDATHRVAVMATHLYPAPEVRRHETHWLSFGSELRVVSASGAFFETAEGLFVPKSHLRPLNAPFADWVTAAQLHFGVPYLWGGNSALGIDCSGLVQAALLAGGIACPGDSDQQRGALGAEIAEGEPPRRGDLYFWKGHVAVAVDGETLIHANGHAMAVSYEGIAAAVARIAAEGPLLARRRLGG
jgi:hypothetical protein